MKKLIRVANHYVETSDWKMIAVLKFCLIALGVLLGMSVRKEHRKPVNVIALAVFLASYIPLMKRFLRIYRESE